MRKEHNNLRKGKNYEEIYGKERAKEIKQKLSDIHKGKTYEEIYGKEIAEKLKEKRRNSRLGYVLPEEIKKKISESTIGWNDGKNYEEMYGKEKSDEMKIKQSKAHKGKEGYWKGKFRSEDTKDKIRQKLLGKERPIGFGEKIAKKLRGQKRSKEIRDKISLTTKLAMQRPEVQEKIKRGYFKRKYNLDEKEVIRLYSNLSAPNIAKKFGCCDVVIYNILNKNNIERKGISYFNKGKHCSPETEFKPLDKHVDWLGGKSFEPYTPDFNERFKEMVRERDNYCCIVCNKHEEELNRCLSIHHIDYDKLNSFPQNCVSLCRLCHAKTNFNREHWKLFFQSLLKERENYEYTEDQKIILDFVK